MARPDKAAAVAVLTEEFRSSSAAVLTEYRGLTVAQLKELRRSLGGATSYAVVKNTLTKIAARDAGVEGLDDLLAGPSAIAFVKGDPVEAAKGLRDFAKAHPLLVIKGGVLDGRPVTPDEIKKLADLESREVLLGRLAGAMQASLTGAVSLFAAPLSQTARLLDALRQKAEQDPSVLAGGMEVPAADGAANTLATDEPATDEAAIVKTSTNAEDTDSAEVTDAADAAEETTDAPATDAPGPAPAEAAAEETTEG
ncbi:MAG: 50S ribosomal protein L10 [Candidatus Nanopelagicales bacterium]